MARLTRRTLLTGTAATGAALAIPGMAGMASAQTTTFAAFRVVRGRAGEPEQPEITLPAGYQIVPGTQHSVASRAEYYTFVRGPRNSAGIDVAVRWPGVSVRTVVHQERHLALQPDPADPDRYRFRLPMTQTSVNANQPTIQVWSFPDISPGMYYRIEHNHPDRVAGPWTTVAWPAGAVRAMTHLLVASYAIWRDSGMVEVAAAKGHRFALMGFETNNTLHPDNPPHWHLSYNSGPDFNSPTHNTHFWLDGQGRTFFNGMDVTGMGRLRHFVGDPAPVYDFVGEANGGRGNLVVTFTIRADGGLDIEPAGGPPYAIAAGRNGDLLDEVTVLRSGQPWLRVATTNRVDYGVLTARFTGLRDPAESATTVYRYDPVTGTLR